MTVDLQGTAVVIGALGAFIVSVGNAIQNWRNTKEAKKSRAKLQDKVDVIGTNVDGHATEQARKIDALTQAVSTQAAGGTIPEQTPGEPGNAPVGVKDGNVTVERRDARQRSTDTVLTKADADNAARALEATQPKRGEQG